MFRNINELGDWIDSGYELAGLVASTHTLPRSCKPAPDFPLDLVPWSCFTHEIMSTATAFANSVFDDIYTLAKMRGLTLSRKSWVYYYADRQCNRLWFTSVLLGLWGERNRLIAQQEEYEELGETGSVENLQKLRMARKLSVVNTAKLACDLVFTSKLNRPFFQ